MNCRHFYQDWVPPSDTERRGFKPDLNNTCEIIERLIFPFPYVLIPVKSKTKLHGIKFRVWAALFKISVSG